MDALVNMSSDGVKVRQCSGNEEISDSESAILEEILEKDLSRRSSFASSVDFDEWMQKHAALDEESVERDSDTHVEETGSTDEEEQENCRNSFAEESAADIRHAWIEAQRQWSTGTQQQNSTCKNIQVVSLDEAIGVEDCEDKYKTFEGHDSSITCNGDEVKANNAALANCIAAVSAQETNRTLCAEDGKYCDGDETQMGFERPPLPHLNNIHDMCEAVNSSLGRSFETVEGIISDRTEWCGRLEEYDVELTQLTSDLSQFIGTNGLLEARIKELEVQLDSERQTHRETEDALELKRNNTDQRMKELEKKNEELLRKLEVFARQCSLSQTREQMLYNTNRELREQLLHTQKIVKSSPTSTRVMEQMRCADTLIVEARRDTKLALEKLSDAQLELENERQRTAKLKRQLSADSVLSIQPEKIAKRDRLYNSNLSSTSQLSPVLPNTIAIHEHVFSAAEHARDRRRNSGPRRSPAEHNHSHSEFTPVTPTMLSVNATNTPRTVIINPSPSSLPSTSRRPATPRIPV
ncbi:hypothetical protein COEREDRAFT_88108 [Coemansia reversa NRRL 1564]|uniref:Uncharacterized protein n=1 Tax=Coemansia reversa (strain ATCC 12441 / NRRL 1564) TaxID=763665 RepID=A0A2G5B8D8_COERN|nr:hypothetical protein COEREDRAFT_88108 [Coemansia reversa NRRL 1564]|eukprot:PIA15264.1 hypothetical protein COEREDRAFT_88108 [Coemansia reversa NRRL 1564]